MNHYTSQFGRNWYLRKQYQKMSARCWFGLALFLAILVPSWLTMTNHDLPFSLPMVEVAQAQEQPADQCGLEVVICPHEQTVGERITEVAVSNDFPSATLIALARCESSLNPKAVGGRLGTFRGLWQWSRKSNPEITDAMAFDVETSTKLTIAALKRGESWRWPNCL